MITVSLTPYLRRSFLSAACLIFASPALADHLGPGGFGAGGGASVFSPDTLDAGHWSAGVRITYTKPEKRSDAELAALAGQDIDAHNTDYNLVGALGIAYGVTHHLTVSAELPYVRRDHLREGTQALVGGVSMSEVEELGSVKGIGDLSLLAKYRVTDSGSSGLALIGGIKLPTGSTHERSLDGQRLETEHQPGTGSWDPVIGVSASTKIAPVQLTASAVYQISTEGAQRTRLGNRLQGGIAISHRFGAAPQEHAEPHNHHHGDELDEHHERAQSTWDGFLELAGEWEGRQKIDNAADATSGGKWAYLAPGLRYNAASGWSASAAVALPIWQRIRASHPDNSFRVMLSLGRGF